MAKPKSKRFSKSSGPKRLLRYLEKGDKLVIKGARGKPVKKIVAGRKYILEVKRKGKLYGYINNTKKKTITVKGKKTKVDAATPQSFTKSMVARLKHTRQVKSPQPNRRSGKQTVKLVSNRRVTSQITTKSRLIREIKENSGSVFNLNMNFGEGEYVDVKDQDGVIVLNDDGTPKKAWTGENITGNRIYYGDDGMSDDELKNLVLSNFFSMVGQRNFRISDRLNKDGTTMNSKRRLIEVADIHLEFSEIAGGKK